MSKQKNQYEELTEQQMRFAENYLEFNNGTFAAVKAGYSENSAASQASRLLKNAKVKEYIEELRTIRRERIMNTLEGYAVEAVKELYGLAMDEEVADNVRLQALKDIMDRSGYKPVEKRQNDNTLEGKIEFGFVDPNAE
jgi:Terminase small subunit